MKWIFISALSISLSLANIIHEIGELSEFIAGHSPGSSYDIKTMSIGLTL